MPRAAGLLSWPSKSAVDGAQRPLSLSGSLLVAARVQLLRCCAAPVSQRVFRALDSGYAARLGLLCALDSGIARGPRSTRRKKVPEEKKKKKYQASHHKYGVSGTLFLIRSPFATPKYVIQILHLSVGAQ